MAGLLRKILTKAKYGDPIIVVSGLPRSGTSMMMKSLEAGGLPIMTDGIRTSDADNPNGYYELERVKDLDKPTDKSWLAEARGKVIKVISFLLKDLPDEHAYKIIFMRRDIREVIASQNKMLDHRGESERKSDDEQAARMFDIHLKKVAFLLRNRKNFDSLDVDYAEALENPEAQARRVQKFLGGRLDIDRMREVADKNLYRNRRG